MRGGALASTLNANLSSDAGQPNKGSTFPMSATHSWDAALSEVRLLEADDLLATDERGGSSNYQLLSAGNRSPRARDIRS